MPDIPDPFAPLVTIGDVTIRQRVGGWCYVRWADGSEEQYGAGWSLRMIEEEVRKKLDKRAT